VGASLALRTRDEDCDGVGIVVLKECGMLRIVRAWITRCESRCKADVPCLAK